MEIELKKVKLTSSIISQILQASLSDLIDNNVIGWVIHKQGKTKIKKVILQDQSSGRLRWYYYPRNLQIDFRDGLFGVLANHSIGSVQFDDYTTEEKAKVIKSQIEAYIKAADFTGQIFY